MCWTLYELYRHPEAMASAQREIDAVLDSSFASAARGDLPKLCYL